MPDISSFDTAVVSLKNSSNMKYSDFKMDDDIYMHSLHNKVEELASELDFFVTG
jgi:hypothetical protein